MYKFSFKCDGLLQRKAFQEGSVAHVENKYHNHLNYLQTEGQDLTLMWKVTSYISLIETGIYIYRTVLKQSLTFVQGILLNKTIFVVTRTF